FVTYIARVLPSLGEDEVTLASLGSMVVGTALVGGAAVRHDEAAVATIKGSQRLVRVLARASQDNPPEAPTELRLLFRGQLLRLERRDLDELRRTVLGLGSPRNAVRRKAAGYLLNALWLQAKELLGSSWSMPREEFAEQIAERREFIAFMNGWWPVLTPIDVLRWLSDPARLRSYANGLLDRTEVALLSGSLAALPPLNKRGEADVSVEDVALIDELDELLGTPPRRKRQAADPYTVNGVMELSTHFERQAAARRAAVERPADYREYAHIVVDEAQDVSPMQWRMIGRRASLASWTIVGDPAQSAWQGEPGETRRARDAALRGRKRNEYALTTNYRNSVEIFDVASSVVRRAIPGIELPTAVRRSGVQPELELVNDLAPAVLAATQRLLSTVEGTVGVVATQASRGRVAGWLASIDDPRLQVVTSMEAKGMEYDGVLVVEPDAIIDESPSGVRTLYVALSRATQRLSTVGTTERWGS
ncbi:MAG TPA: UvrD-helicase domain-containing protein, partial [Micromonosporaceae bacterium]